MQYEVNVIMSEHYGKTSGPRRLQKALLSGQVGAGPSCLSTLAPPNVNKSHTNQYFGSDYVCSDQSKFGLPRGKINHVACPYVVHAENGQGCHPFRKYLGDPLVSAS